MIVVCIAPWKYPIKQKKQMEQWNGKKKGKNCLSNIISPKTTYVRTHKHTQKVSNQAYFCDCRLPVNTKNYSKKKKCKEQECLVSKHSLHSIAHYTVATSYKVYDTHQIIVIAVIYYFTILILSNVLDTTVSAAICKYKKFRIGLYPFLVTFKQDWLDIYLK